MVGSIDWWLADGSDVVVGCSGVMVSSVGCWLVDSELIVQVWWLVVGNGGYRLVDGAGVTISWLLVGCSGVIVSGWESWLVVSWLFIYSD